MQTVVVLQKHRARAREDLERDSSTQSYPGSLKPE